MDVVTAAIGLATQILLLINTEESQKYVNQLAQVQLDLQAEKAKGYLSDDAKIENLEQQVGILCQAVQNEIKVFEASGQSTAPAAASAASNIVSAVAKS